MPNCASSGAMGVSGLSQEARPSGASKRANVSPFAWMGHRRPRSSTTVWIPACANRRAATAPPKPLPITTAGMISAPYAAFRRLEPISPRPIEPTMLFRKKLRLDMVSTDALLALCGCVPVEVMRILLVAPASSIAWAVLGLPSLLQTSHTMP